MRKIISDAALEAEAMDDVLAYGDLSHSPLDFTSALVEEVSTHSLNRHIVNTIG